MSTLSLSLLYEPSSNGFKSPEFIEVNEDKVREIISQVHDVMTQTTLPIEEMGFAPSFIETETDIMGWELSNWFIGKDHVSLAMEDINGSTILYQAEIPPY